MNLLAVAAHLPAFDRASGDLRFFQMLRILAEEHRVTLATFKTGDQRAERGDRELARYRSALEQTGITVIEDDVISALRRQPTDLVLFETHRACRKWIGRARFEQPGARAIVDSVDCHFVRLGRRAEMTGQAEHRQAAAAERALELEAYSRADLVIVVTEEDRRLIAECLPGKPLALVPNIHAMPAVDLSAERVPGRIVFLGGFKHEPNVDAICSFCRDVFPRVSAEVPSARLLIAGSDPPPSVKDLASERIEVLGYVPDLAPLLRSAAVSVAPIRYGAGQKGKVGEAMSFALPVVTTSIGAEGFGLENGAHAIIADDPADFAANVVFLLRQPRIARQIGERGRALIDLNFSVNAVGPVVLETFKRAAGAEIGRLPIGRRLRIASSVALDRHLLWRFR